MKNKLLLLLLISFISINAKCLKGQNKTIVLGPNYQSQSFYSLENGETQNILNDNWDLAMSTDAYSTTIRINGGKGVELYLYHLGDTSNWTNISSSIVNNLTEPVNNSDTGWSIGAFDMSKDNNNSLDYGWGVYSMITHKVVGDSIFIIKTVNGNWKKLWIQEKVLGDYKIRFANLDGSNDYSEIINASTYDDKHFVYYSLENQSVLDREPNKDNWDLTFTKYITDYPFQGTFVPYSVTGVLSNIGVEVARAENITSPTSYTDYNNHTFNAEINTIGFNWKNFDGTGYSIDPYLCYFVKDLNESIWRIIFTGFSGMASGSIEFNAEKLEASSTSQNFSSIRSFNIYPNPINNQDATLLYDVEGDVKTLQIICPLGKTIFKSSLNNNNFNALKIPTSNFKSGLYVVLLNDQFNNTIITEKILVY